MTRHPKAGEPATASSAGCLSQWWPAPGQVLTGVHDYKESHNISGGWARAVLAGLWVLRAALRSPPRRRRPFTRTAVWIHVLLVRM